MSNKMNALVFTGENELNIETLDIPKIKEDEILVKIEYCAICTWEQRAYKGVNKVPYPFIGGHEVSGVIQDVGTLINQDHWQIGSKVVVGLMTSCGQCDSCKNGEEGNCESFDYANRSGGLPYPGMGGFAQYVAVPISKVFKLEDHVPLLEATMTEPISCVVHSINIGDIQLGDKVVVLGLGIMGLLHVKLAKMKGAYVIGIDRNDNRCEAALKQGADVVFNNRNKDELDFIMDKTNNRGAEIVFLTVSDYKAAEKSIEYLTINGKSVLYSSFYPDHPISTSPNRIHRRMTAVTGSANSNSKDYLIAAKLLNNELIDVRDLISEVVDLKDAEYAFKRAEAKDTYRVVIKVGE